MDDRNLLDFLFAKSKFRMCLRGQHSRTIIVYFLVFCTVCMCTELIFASDCQTDNDCINGKCRDGDCLCDDGWTGEPPGSACIHCAGRRLLQEPTGYIVESHGEYAKNKKCTWLIDSGQPGATINIYLDEFATECSWDYLYIYDGDSIHSDLVAAFSGPIRHEDVDIIHEVSVTSGYAYLYFYSDAAFILEGFNITYSVNTCPFNCSSHGTCNVPYLNCTCDLGWLGDDCSIPSCPNNCTNNGICDVDARTCQCQNGYRGRDCSIGPEDGVWTIDEEATRLGRASPATVLDRDTLWVIGGYDFQEGQHISVIKRNLLTGEEEEVDAKGASGELPEARYGHSAVMYENLIFVYGGSLIGEMVVNDILVFDIHNSTWHNTTHTKAVSVEGHSAHVIGNVMIIIFGYSPEFSYVDFVQEYNLITQVWDIVRAKGIQVKGSYGHSSVYDPKRKLIYVHGGYTLKSASQHQLSDGLLVYNPGTQHWSVLAASHSQRFLHAAAILDNKMFVFGGNTHIDSIKSTGAKCYSSDFLAYDIDCNSWSVIPAPSDLYKDISRYGHAMFAYNGAIHVYNGFNGVMISDLLTYDPGDCSAFDNETLCVVGTPGLSCAWNQLSSLCIPQSQYIEANHTSALCLEPETEEPKCSEHGTCGSCVLEYGCGWCSKECKKVESCPATVDSITCDPPTQCELYTNCLACSENRACQWNDKDCEDRNTENGADTVVNTCSDPCEDYSNDCKTCLKGTKSCMWCESCNRCIDSNTYMTSFPYGLCLEWRTDHEDCPAHGCRSHQTCTECQSNPECGWCDDERLTGLGTCIEGSYRGPLDTTNDQSQVDYGLCPADRWYFVDCPSCQCNGHSKCVNESVCENCQNFTTGDQCEGCTDGYFGNPVNGGSCAPCSCNAHADNCDANNGRCYCDTKGITGDQCDTCDTKSRYSGSPLHGGTCFYKLMMNFQYTFNLSSPEDKYYTKINMLTSPDSSNRDIEFSLRVKKPVNMSITFTTNKDPGIEVEVERAEVLEVYNTHFSRYDYDFSDDANTTFYIYLSNFTTPLWFQMAANQQEDWSILIRVMIYLICALVLMLIVMAAGWRVHQLVMTRQNRQASVMQSFMLMDLLHFLIIFFSCFLSFLLFFVVGWKVKQRCDHFRHQQIVNYQPQPLLGIFIAFFVTFIGILMLFGIGLKVKDVVVRRRRIRTHAQRVCINCTWTTRSPPVTSGPDPPNWGEGRWIFFSMLVLATYAGMACCWNKVMLRTRQNQLEQAMARYNATRIEPLPVPSLWGLFLAFLLTFIIMLSLILVAFRLHMWYDDRRRLEQRAVELAVMASRPFSRVNVDIERHDPPDLVTSKPKKHPLALTIEPCRDNKAAVLTIFMQLPMPEGDAVPFNTSRLTLASALVQLKHGHKRHDRGELRERRTSNPGHRRETQEHSMCHPAEYDNPAMV